MDEHFSGLFKDSKFGNSSYTLGYVLEKLRKNGTEFMKCFENLHYTEIKIDEIGIGRGFCSWVFRVTLKVDNKQHAFIVKISTNEKWVELNKDFNESTKINIKWLVEQMHNCECQAFKLLNFMEDFPVPKAYYIEETSERLPGMIVMEDMRVGTSLFDVYSSASPKQCFDLAEQIAKLQAFFNFLPDKDEWTKKLSLYNIQLSKEMNIIWAEIIRTTLALNNKEMNAQIQEFLNFDLQKLNKFTLQECSAEIDSNTICRGELWAGNILMKLDENGECSNKIGAIIDWQTVMLGNPLYDISTFMVLCTTVEIRREYEKKIVDFYYYKLFKLYEKNRMKPSFSREQAHKFYELSLLHSAGHQIMIFTVQALSLQNSTNLEEKHNFDTLFERLKASFEDVDYVMKKYGLNF